MRSIVKRLYEFLPSLDEQTEAAESTIAVLKSDVEEDADVSGQLIELLTTLNTQLQKIEAR
jgi:hypothetical protein